MPPVTLHYTDDTKFSSSGVARLLGSARGLNPQWLKRIRARLVVLDNASNIDEIAVIGWRLHELKGNRSGIWAINLTGNFRITFRPEIHETDAEQFDVWDVDLEDCHA